MIPGSGTTDSREVLMRFVLCLSLLLVPALNARGADDVLQLRSGRLVVGTITATDTEGVTVRTETGEARFDWSALTPLTEYEVRSDRLKPDDASGRVELAELCIRHGLYPYARKEIATARGLGFEPAARLNEIEEAANDAEADEAFARAEQLVAEEDYEGALDVVRRFLIQAPKSDRTEKARALANDLLRRIDNQQLAEKEAAEAAGKAELSEALAKKITDLVAKSEESLKAAAAASARSVAAWRTTRRRTRRRRSGRSSSRSTWAWPSSTSTTGTTSPARST